MMMHSVFRSSLVSLFISLAMARAGVSAVAHARAVAAVGEGSWLELAIPPSANSGYAAVYDPLGDRMIVFGGGHLWSLSLSGTPIWSQLSATGTPPSYRVGHTAIYDPVRDRVIIFGGSSALGQGIQTNDTWALSLSGIPAWSQLSPAGTPPHERLGHTAIYDPPRDRMVVFGGYYIDPSCCGVLLNDTRALTLSGTPTWSQLGSLGPDGHAEATAIYDPAMDRMVVSGGTVPGASVSDTWELTLSGTPAWAGIASQGPNEAGESSIAIDDPIGDRMIVFGGRDDSTVPHDETWALSLSGLPTWSQLSPSGNLPPARYEHAAIYDPVRDRIIVLGGLDINGNELRDTWALSLMRSDGGPGEALSITVTPAIGDSFTVDYTPACNAADHVIYLGTAGPDPISGAVSWTVSLCHLGTSGNVTVDPGSPALGRMFYFVIVGQDATREGSYGRNSSGLERPEAMDVGACDLPRVVQGSCQTNGGCLMNGKNPPPACTSGQDLETRSPYVICSSDCNAAWIAHSDSNGGFYHALQICQTFGYSTLGEFGGTCGALCGYCETGTSCTMNGQEIFDGSGNDCGSDVFGLILCETVHWQCLR